MFRSTLLILSALPLFACGTPMESERSDAGHDLYTERQAETVTSIKPSKKATKLAAAILDSVVIVADDDDQTMQDCVDQSFDVYECLDCCIDAFPDGGALLDECDAGCSDQCPEADPWDKINECLDESTNTSDCQDCCADGFRNDPSSEEICNEQCEDLCEDDDCTEDNGGFGEISG